MKVFKFSSTDFIPASHEDSEDPGTLKKVMYARNMLPDGWVQMVNWAQLRPGKSFQNHYHEKMSEVFIFVSGKVEFVVDGEKVELGRGDGVLVDAGAPHTAKNIGDTDANYICFGIVHTEGGKTVIVE